MSLSHLCNFHVWIIGGSDNEAHNIYDLLTISPPLNEKLTKNEILIWGRIENDALPEFLSRSSVVVMPSYREQFGMVAIEAMQCGCPVVAAKVGGLQDIIITQKTGFLFERGNSSSLSAILSGFLRNIPDRIRLRNQSLVWGETFSQEKTFKAITKIYVNEEQLIPDFWQTVPNKDQSHKIEHHFEKLTGEKIKSYKIVHSHGKHKSFLVNTEKKNFFMKIINDAPSCQASVFPINYEFFHSPKCSKERFYREIYQSENPISPSLIKYDINNKVIIWESLKICNKDIFSNPDLLGNLMEEIQQFAPIDNDDPRIINYKEFLTDFEVSPNLNLIEKFDKISSNINQIITKNYPSYTRTHPQIELYRLMFLLEEHTWVIPIECHCKFLQAINCLIKSVEFTYEKPTLIHGDLKPDHFLYRGSKILICDWEHSKYCNASLEAAIIAYKLYLKNNSPQMDTAQKYLLKLVKGNKEMFRQGACWLVAQCIFASIYWYTQGDENALKRGYNSLKDFALNWYKSM